MPPSKTSTEGSTPAYCRHQSHRAAKSVSTLKTEATNFDEFFNNATGHGEPFAYQCRLACGEKAPDESEGTWLSHGTACRSKLINIPTGLGKTAGVVLA